MSQTLLVPAVTLAITLAMMFVVWLLSLSKKDSSIVDIFWGIGFVLIAGVCFVLGDGYVGRKLLVSVLTALWGIRLAAYILWRNAGKGEDYRYRAMRSRYGKRFPLVSLLLVFGLQGLLMWIISMPLQVAGSSREPARFTWLDWTGASLWLAGFLFESIGDFQLARFKSDPNNAGQVMDRGLWRYTRHPNYFGDATLWWGFFLIALSTPRGAWTIFSPLIMTTLLMKVSGVALLEKTLRKTKPEYQNYIERTSAFVPWPPGT